MVRYDHDPISVDLDRAGEYSAVLKTKYTLDVLLTAECCKWRCYTKMTRAGLAAFRCKVVNHLSGAMTYDQVRRAITAEVKRRSYPCADGTVDIDTDTCGVVVCLAFFYRVLGVGHYMMETIFRDVWHSSSSAPPSRHAYGCKDATVRSLARVANKIREVGEPHPVDHSIMIPPTEKRRHFLRSGAHGGGVLSRKTLKVFFGAPVRVHKASSFMKCPHCIAMKLYAEDRSSLHRRVVSLMSAMEHGQTDLKRGQMIKTAARLLARERREGADFAELREEIRKEVNRTQDEPDEEEEGELEDNEDDESRRAGPITAAEKRMKDLHDRFMADCIDTRQYLRALNDTLKGLASLEETMRKFHYKCVMIERVLVCTAQEVAASCPDDVGAFIVDGCGKERTKIPYYPERMKGVAEDAKLLKCPVYGIQEAVPISVVSASEAEQHIGASDFELRTTDFIVALEWTTVGGADLYGSILIHFLYSKTCVPRVLVLVLDNARVNKGEPLMAWLGLIMMKTHIEEIHVYFPSKGHTHTSLDAHFGKAKPKDPSKTVLTPQALQRHLNSLPRTSAVLDFALYEIADRLGTFARSYNNRLDQHHFILLKHRTTGEIVFKYTPLLRFAENMTTRVRSQLETHSYFMPMTDEEREEGIPVFNMEDGGTADHLEELVARAMPSPHRIPRETVKKLAKEIPNLYARGKAGKDTLEELKNLEDLARSEHGYSLGRLLEEIKSKAAPRNRPVGDSDDAGEILEDLMRQVNIRKQSDKLCASVESDRQADAPKIRAQTVKTVLSVLRRKYAGIDQDFVTLASTHSNGEPVHGYKPILAAMRKELAIPGAPARSSRPTLTGAVSVSPQVTMSPAKRDKRATVATSEPPGAVATTSSRMDDDEEEASTSTTLTGNTITRSGRTTKKPTPYDC